jgi:hypothetical protein
MMATIKIPGHMRRRGSTEIGYGVAALMKLSIRRVDNYMAADKPDAHS